MLNLVQRGPAFHTFLPEGPGSGFPKGLLQRLFGPAGEVAAPALPQAAVPIHHEGGGNAADLAEGLQGAGGRGQEGLQAQRDPKKAANPVQTILEKVLGAANDPSAAK